MGINVVIIKLRLSIKNEALFPLLIKGESVLARGRQGKG